MFNNTTKYYSPNTENGILELNLENCESYLLLYIDDELTEAEKQSVTLFLQNEPKAQQLLSALQQTILQVENQQINKLDLYQSASIDSYNIEQYALHYIDGELGISDTINVENYIASNADAKNMLALLEKTKLNSSTFNVNKTTLLKVNNNAFQANTNISEALAAKLDNELNTKQNLAINNAIAKEPAIASEWSILQKTKLTPEAIVFPNKELLYNKAKKETPIIPMLSRYAAAVALIIGSAAMFFNNTNSKKMDNAVTIVKPNSNLVQPSVKSNSTDAYITVSNSTVASQKVQNVKNALTVKKAVTKEKLVRTTNETGSPKKVLSNINYKDEIAIILPSLQKQSTVQPLADESKVTMALHPPFANAVSQNSTGTANISKAVSDNVSFFEVPITKIAENKVVVKESKKIKQRFNDFIKAKKEAILNPEANISVFEIDIAKLRK